MSEVVLTRTKFTMPADFDPDSFFASALGVVEGKGDHEIVIRFSAAVATRIEERDWHESQQLHRRDNGSIDLTLRLSSLIEIERWVLGWGAEAEVLAPAELREQLSRTVLALAVRYDLEPARLGPGEPD